MNIEKQLENQSFGIGCILCGLVASLRMDRAGTPYL